MIGSSLFPSEMLNFLPSVDSKIEKLDGEYPNEAYALFKASITDKEGEVVFTFCAILLCRLLATLITFPSLIETFDCPLKISIPWCL